MQRANYLQRGAHISVVLFEQLYYNTRKAHEFSGVVNMKQ